MSEEKQSGQQLDPQARLYQAILDGDLMQAELAVSDGADIHAKYKHQVVFDVDPNKLILANLGSELGVFHLGIFKKGTLRCSEPTPLLLATAKGYKDMVRCLITKGASFKHLNARLQYFVKLVAVYGDSPPSPVDIVELDKQFCDKFLFLFNEVAHPGRAKLLVPGEYDRVQKHAVSLLNTARFGAGAYHVKKLLNKLQSPEFYFIAGKTLPYVTAFIQTHGYEMKPEALRWFEAFEESVKQTDQAQSTAGLAGEMDRAISSFAPRTPGVTSADRPRSNEVLGEGEVSAGLQAEAPEASALLQSHAERQKQTSREDKNAEQEPISAKPSPVVVQGLKEREGGPVSASGNIERNKGAERNIASASSRKQAGSSHTMLLRYLPSSSLKTERVQHQHHRAFLLSQSRKRSPMPLPPSSSSQDAVPPTNGPAPTQ
jgi:hypothetical protein